MSELFFLFDLDSTITKQEILPTIAQRSGCAHQMRELTEKAMSEIVPFRQSFLDRVRLLEKVPVSEVNEMIANIPVHEDIVDFMMQNRQRCFIITGNLDVWISGLIDKIGMVGHSYCSHGIVQNDRLLGVASVIDKNATVAQFVNEFVAVGDGSNDADMISQAKIGIGFGGVRPIAPAVLTVASHAIYEERKLCQFLKRLS